MITLTVRGKGIEVQAETKEAGIKKIGRKLGYSSSQTERMWLTGRTMLAEGLYMHTLALSPNKREKAKGINASSVIGTVIIQTIQTEE